jgi:Transposase domain (DUF772)
LARGIDWGFLEQRLGAVYTDRPGRPPLPTRLMAGLAILKHMHNLSDEDLCARWIENPYYQLLCGEEFFRHALPFDRSSITRWRQRMGEADPRFCQAELGGMVGGGEEKLIALLQESLHLATRAGAAKPSDFARVIVDTTVQPKAVAFPTDAKLLHRARERLARLARKHGVPLRQSYADARLRDIFAVRCRSPGACASSARGTAGRRSTACMPPRWNVSAKARRTGRTSSASRSRSRHRCDAAREVSSSSPPTIPRAAAQLRDGLSARAVDRVAARPTATRFHEAQAL